MNLQVRGTVHTNTKPNTGTTMSLDIDAAVLPGDLLVAQLSQTSSGQTINPPTGWTADINAGQGANTTNVKNWLMHRVAQAGDAGTSVTFTSNNTQNMSGALAAFYDVDGGSFSGALDGTPASHATGVDSTTEATPTMTTALANSLVVYALGMGKTGGGSWTAPGGTPTITELSDVTSGPGASTLAWMVQATAGTVASRTWTASATFDTVSALVVAFAYTPPAAPAISTLTDDFDDNALDVAKWVNNSGGTATLAETGQHLVMTPPASTAGTNYAVLNSLTAYNLTGSAVFVNLAQSMNLGASKDASFFVYADANNAVGFTLQFSATVQTLKTMQKVAGVTTTPTTIFSAAGYSASHRWLRMRESAGTTYWETSPDSVVWTTQQSTANPITVTAVKVELDAGTFGSTASPGSLIWDSLNIANSAPQLRGATSSNTSTSTGSLPLTLDASIVAGDLIVAEIAQASSGSTITGPSGWTMFDSRVASGTANIKLTLWWKLAAAGDAGATRTWTSSASTAMSGAAQAFSDPTGAGWGTNPLDVSVSTATTVDATTIIPVMPTTNAANEVVLFALAVGEVATGTAAFTPPTGTPTITELADVATGAQASTLCWMVQATADTLATRTWTITGLTAPTTFDTAVAIVAAFAPAVAASVSTGTDGSVERGVSRGVTRGMVS